LGIETACKASEDFAGCLREIFRVFALC
jgi:hypothetical protein